MARVENFVNGLYTSPLPTPNATLPGILTYGRVRCELIPPCATMTIRLTPAQTTRLTVLSARAIGPTSRKCSLRLWLGMGRRSSTKSTSQNSSISSAPR